MRIVQRSDEQINLMILESLSELSPTIEQLIHTIQYAERPYPGRPPLFACASDVRAQGLLSA